MEQSIYMPAEGRNGAGEAARLQLAACELRASALADTEQRLAAACAADAPSSTRGRVVSGALPVLVTCAPADVAVERAPAPLATLLPRCAFLAPGCALARQCAAFFAPALATAPGKGGVDIGEAAALVWFSVEGAQGEAPLKSWWPAGAQYDLLARRASPWRLTAHFSRWPFGEGGAAALALAPRVAFASALKEAVFARHGSARAIMSAPAATLEALWEAVDAADADAWRAPAEQLECSSSSSGAEPRGAPLRMYARGVGGAVEVATRLANPRAALGDELRRFLQAGLAGIDIASLEGVEVRTQGVDPPLDAPVGELLASLAGPDGFLHVTLVTEQQ